MYSIGIDVLHNLTIVDPPSYLFLDYAQKLNDGAFAFQFFTRS